jgi:uncharacterized membrane protein YvlD (DUF360 family)
MSRSCSSSPPCHMHGGSGTALFFHMTRSTVMLLWNTLRREVLRRNAVALPSLLVLAQCTSGEMNWSSVLAPCPPDLLFLSVPVHLTHVTFSPFSLAIFALFFYVICMRFNTKNCISQPLWQWKNGFVEALLDAICFTLIMSLYYSVCQQGVCELSRLHSFVF